MNKIDADKAGVDVNERGVINVDKQMRTYVPNIFAIGDVVPGPMLAHKATHEAKVAAEVAAGEKSAFDARTIPSVAYTDPEDCVGRCNGNRSQRAGHQRSTRPRFRGRRVAVHCRSVAPKALPS